MKKESKIVNFVRESLVELKKVSWPKKEEVINSTVIVFVVVIAIALILGFFDYVVGQAVLYIFKP